MSINPNSIFSKNKEDQALIYKLICQQYPGKIPVIFLMKDKKEGLNGTEIKFIAAPETTLIYLASQIRQQMNLDGESSLYFYTPMGRILKQDSMISEIYEMANDETGFLFIEFSQVDCMGR